MENEDILGMVSFLQNKGINVAEALQSMHCKCDDCDRRNETVMYHHDIYPDYEGCQDCYEEKLKAIEDEGYNFYLHRDDDY